MIKRHFATVIVCGSFMGLILATPTLAGRAQYTYDNLDRLVQVQFDDGTTIQYSYDAAGNRLAQQVTTFHGAAPATAPDSGPLAQAPANQPSPPPASGP